MLNHLLTNKELDKNIENSEGDLPIIQAAAEKSNEIVDILLSSKGIEINYPGAALLPATACSGDYERVKKLLDNKKIDINSRGGLGRTALN